MCVSGLLWDLHSPVPLALGDACPGIRRGDVVQAGGTAIMKKNPVVWWAQKAEVRVQE